MGIILSQWFYDHRNNLEDCMNFSFSGRHMEIGESLSKKAREACEALADKYNVGFIDVSIVMKKDNYRFYTDISVKTGTGNSYKVSNEADDPVVSFEGVMPKLDAQMRKKKDSMLAASRKKNIEIHNFDNSLLKDSGEESASRIIIAEIIDELAIMSVSEAADHLSEKRHVFVFKNISNDAVNVVYLREDGNVGWIDYKIG